MNLIILDYIDIEREEKRREEKRKEKKRASLNLYTYVSQSCSLLLLLHLG